MAKGTGGSGRSASKRPIKGRSLGEEFRAIASGVEHALELPCVARADWSVLACEALAPSFVGGAVAISIARVSANGEVLKIESFGAQGVELDWARRLFMDQRLPELDASEVMVWEDGSNPSRGGLASWWTQARLGTRGHKLVVWGSSRLPNIGLVMELVVARLAARAELAFGDCFTSCLTACEVRVLELLVEGRTVREIATEICRSPHTVHDHVKRLHRKLGATSRGELISRALGRRTGSPCMEFA